MSKIIKFKTDTDNVLDFLKELEQEVKESDISNLVIAGKCKDGSVLVGFTKNVDFGTSQELIGHIQSHLNMRMIDYKLFGE